MSASALARNVGVDRKTALRWLSGERVPHTTTRMRVAEVLGVSAESLWPEAVRSALKLGTDREIVRAYARRNEVSAAVWAGLLNDAREDILMGGYTSYFMWLEQPRIIDRLRAKLADGCRVRFLLGDPDSELTRGREQVEADELTVGTRIRITLGRLAELGDGVEVRFSDSPAHLSASTFRYDDQLLQLTHIAAGLGHDSTVLHLRRGGDDGLFAQFARHAEFLWDAGRPVPIVGAAS